MVKCKGQLSFRRDGGLEWGRQGAGVHVGCCDHLWIPQFHNCGIMSRVECWVKWNSIYKCTTHPTPSCLAQINPAVSPGCWERTACMCMCVWRGLGRIGGIKGAQGAGCPGRGREELLQEQGDYVMGRAQLCLLLPSKATAALWTQPLAPKS